ncbi:MAG: type I restriction enzyme S subunit [Oleispira sp.]|jgi:type I restriction enzyme S subunit
MSNAVPKEIIPVDWDISELNEYLFFVSYGFTNPMPESTTGPIMVTAKDVKGLKVQYTSARKTTWQAYKELLTDKSKPRIDDVLLTKDGTLGRVALVEKDNICINQSVAVLRSNHRILPVFLLHLLASPIYQKIMLDNAGGSAIKHIYITILSKMIVAIPSIIEQKKIAAILSSVDEVIEKTQAQINKLKDLKTGMMQELLSPREGQAANINNPQGESKNSLHHTEFKDSVLGRIPAGWEARSLGDVCQFTQGVQISSDNLSRYNGNEYIRYMYIRDFTSDNRIWYVKNEHPHKIITSADIAMANTGHTSGTVYKGKYGVLSNNAFKISFSNEILNTDFLFYFLQSDFFKRKIQQLFNTAGQPHVGHGNIARMPIPIPPLKEQVLIAESIFKIEESEKVKVKKLKSLSYLKKALMQDLLTGKVRVNAD